MSTVYAGGYLPWQWAGKPLRCSNTYESGGGEGGYREGFKSHTERKFIDDVHSTTEAGDLLLMNGIANPYRPRCQPQIRSEVQNTGANALYTAKNTGLTYTWTPYQAPNSRKGTVLQQVTDNKSNVVGTWRYWQVDGRWKRAEL